MTTYYIDPSASVNGNGLSESSPFNTWGSVTFASGNEYLQRQGTTYNGQISITAADVLLSVYGPKVIPLESGLVQQRPKINGAGLNRCITVGVGASNVTITSYEVFGANNRTPGTVRGIAVGSTTTSRADGCTLINCVVRDINSGALTDDENGISVFSNDFTMLDCEVYNIADDGLWIAGNNAEVGRVHIHHVATSDRIAGDCLQFGSNVGFGDNYWVYDCILDHSDVEMKQCFIDAAGSGATGATGGIFERNVCIMGTDNFQVDASKNLNIKNAGAVVRHNHIEGGWAAAWLDGNVLFYSNIVKGYKQTGAKLYALSNGIMLMNNTFDGSRGAAPTSATQAAVSIDTTTVACKVYNNIGINNIYGVTCYKTGAVTNGIDVASNCFNGGTPFSITGGQPVSNITSNPLLDAAYRLQDGSPCLESGYKYWGTNARPNDFNGNPLPDIGIDIGAVQGTSHPFHPVNL